MSRTGASGRAWKMWALSLVSTTTPCSSVTKAASRRSRRERVGRSVFTATTPSTAPYWRTGEAKKNPGTLDTRPTANWLPRSPAMAAVK